MSTETESLRTEIETLIERFKTVQFACVNESNEPLASYAPFVRHNGDFYIYVSALAPHTACLKTTPTASLLFIEEEQVSRNLFARLRLILQCSVTEVGRDGQDYETMLDRFADKFGPTIAMLRQLPDFSLLRMEITSGRFVKGFGAAYSVTDKAFNQLQQVTGK
ncbi:putative heme iron utilization protein [Hahella chejuensis KCTC 2396]|uniref:Putative heme iron utilization protein n=1 Tax=Hahella chejuensis (strain KCTC 2396) TaxID=349521 RepID=Q2SA83_HAHCH|nr:pyridoxamine 5'-phosphate oxidase family protein [Hahella chejuensis]ABC32441.1 putative heme iron utilization protein [Hahella chejuensis KCTC 2396]